MSEDVLGHFSRDSAIRPSLDLKRPFNLDDLTSLPSRHDIQPGTRLVDISPAFGQGPDSLNLDDAVDWNLVTTNTGPRQRGGSFTIDDVQSYYELIHHESFVRSGSNEHKDPGGTNLDCVNRASSPSEPAQAFCDGMDQDNLEKRNIQNGHLQRTIHFETQQAAKRRLFSPEALTSRKSKHDANGVDFHQHHLKTQPVPLPSAPSTFTNSFFSPSASTGPLASDLGRTPQHFPHPHQQLHPRTTIQPHASTTLNPPTSSFAPASGPPFSSDLPNMTPSPSLASSPTSPPEHGLQTAAMLMAQHYNIDPTLLHMFAQLQSQLQNSKDAKDVLPLFLSTFQAMSNKEPSEQPPPHNPAQQNSAFPSAPPEPSSPYLMGMHSPATSQASFPFSPYPQHQQHSYNPSHYYAQNFPQYYPQNYSYYPQHYPQHFPQNFAPHLPQPQPSTQNRVPYTPPQWSTGFCTPAHPRTHSPAFVPFVSEPLASLQQQQTFRPSSLPQQYPRNNIEVSHTSAFMTKREDVPQTQAKQPFSDADGLGTKDDYDSEDMDPDAEGDLDSDNDDPLSSLPHISSMGIDASSGARGPAASMNMPTSYPNQMPYAPHVSSGPSMYAMPTSHAMPPHLQSNLGNHMMYPPVSGPQMWMNSQMGPHGMNGIPFIMQHSAPGSDVWSQNRKFVCPDCGKRYKQKSHQLSASRTYACSFW
eukprot:c10559_g1_i3.p1 GENE.c10559_g1_i3~~c10559_g1_i3.p1  ORF type:complete len:698 (+),score=82.88 c10559_g1_i3:151-2244(+)